MTTVADPLVVDADGHVLEPADTWLKYLEPSFRDRAIRIAQDEHGYEVLLIDGQPLKTLRGSLGALGGIGMDTTRLLARGKITYAEGTVQEMIRARRDGCVGIFLSPDLAARGGRHFDDPAFARFWETAQELEMPIAFHVVVRDRQWFRQWQRRDPSDALFSIAFLAIDVMAAFTQMLAAGMFERYPRLKCAVLEAGSNWIAAWLDRLDHKYRVMKHQTPIRMEPSEYFRRQCLISADPDESVTAQMVEHVGADYFIWASDYPHIDASFGVVRELKARLAPLPEDARRKVLGLNAQRFYRLAG